MNYFLNYKNGDLQIRTYRAADAAVTDVADIKQAYKQGREESLTASFDVETYESGHRDKKYNRAASIKMPGLPEFIRSDGDSDESATENVLDYFIKYIKHSKIESN